MTTAMRPQAFRDPATGFCGWVATLPGQRDLTTPAVGEGRVFLGGGFGSYDFHALDAVTGVHVWSRRTRDDGPTAAVLAETCVVFNTESCTLTVLRTATGELVWERWLGDPLLSQPAVAHGVVVMHHPTRDHHDVLAAFRLADGQPLWSVRLPAGVITAPVVAEGAVWVSTYDGRVSCLDLDSGALRWQRDERVTSAPWVWKGEAFVSAREEGQGPELFERTAGTRPEHRRWMHGPRSADYLRSKRGTPWESLHHARDASVGFGTAPAAAKLHQVEDLVGETTVAGTFRYQGSRPCVWNGRLYATAGDVLTATDLATSQEVWRWEGGFEADGERVLSPPAVANGRVWAGSRDGRIRSWDAETGALRWAVPVGASAVSQPTLWQGRVYAGLDGGRLVAFATQDPADHGWPMWGGGPGHNG